MKLTLAFVSKDSEFKMPSDYTDGIELNGADITFEYYPNNSKPLAAIYNEIIAKHADSGEYVALVHADVRFDVVNLYRHLDSCLEKYDVFGLCGCAKISLSQTPFNWFCGSRPYPEFRWGCVSHGELGNQRSYFSQHSPQVMDHEVACIDGLCIILSPTAIKSGLRFDETLGRYNLYDTDISFQTIFKYKMKLGVLVTMDLFHFSVGKSILTDEFKSDEIRFREKWKHLLEK